MPSGELNMPPAIKLRRVVLYGGLGDVRHAGIPHTATPASNGVAAEGAVRDVYCADVSDTATLAVGACCVGSDRAFRHG